MIFTNTSSSSGSATSRCDTRMPASRRRASALSTSAALSTGMRCQPAASTAAPAASAGGSSPPSSFTRSTRSEKASSSRCVESSATMRPAFIIAMREQRFWASSR